MRLFTTCGVLRDPANSQFSNNLHDWHGLQPTTCTSAGLAWLHRLSPHSRSHQCGLLPGLNRPAAQSNPIVVQGSPLDAYGSCYVDSLRPQESEMIPGCAALLVLATLSHSQNTPTCISLELGLVGMRPSATRENRSVLVATDSL